MTGVRLEKRATCMFADNRMTSLTTECVLLLLYNRMCSHMTGVRLGKRATCMFAYYRMTSLTTEYVLI